MYYSARGAILTSSLFFERSSIMLIKTNARPFGWRDRLGYLLGDFGNDFTFILSSSFLLKFYTDVIGVSAAVVGVVMMLARFVDAFTDVTMGRITDRAKRRASGKFKPWILRMCLPVAFSSFLIYQSAIATAPMWARIGWLAVTYVLWGSVFYTTVNIPYGSMASAYRPSRITDSPCPPSARWEARLPGS